MKVDLSYLIRFPKDSPLATAGVFFPDDKILITGHDNGLVVLWDLTKNTHKKIYECSSKIETITCSQEKELVIGSHSGDIVVLSLDGGSTVIKSATPSVHSRVWKSLWVEDDAFVTSSTYGEISLFRKEAANQWDQTKLYGHSDSVFGMGKSAEGFLATGDYFGNIFIWVWEDGEYRTVQKIKIQNAVEGIAWYTDEIFAAINRGGKIYLFEKTPDEENNWKLVFEVENATSIGTSITITEDGKTVFAGTGTEVIQFDAETHQMDSIKTSGVQSIFTRGNDVFVLTSYGLLHFERKPVEFRTDLIKYKYVKVGLIGHTGVGKSTLCSVLALGTPGEQISTLGKRVWNWELPKDDDLQKRIILFDHGGQETVLSTFLPFLLDSDVILILFQQTDLTTFHRAFEIYNALEDKITDRTKVFFAQTFIDQKDIAEFNEKKIENLIEEKRIVDNLKVCPKYGMGIDKLKVSLLGEISWDRARTTIQTVYTDGVLQTILALQRKDTNVISLDDFIETYEETTGLHIARAHLKFLLRDYSSQGMIEYNPEVLDLIIFNEPEYNRLKTGIPIYVMKRNGIVSVEELWDEFKNSKFLPVIDALYLEYKIAVDNFQRRIFPELLDEKPVVVPKELFEFISEIPTKTRLLQDQKLKIGYFIEALSELKLKCINASQKDGLFSWEENAILYYSFERIGNILDGFHIRCNYRVGGRKKQVCDRLESEFLNIIERLYGPFVTGLPPKNKKKVEPKRDIIYDVAISYASEQLDYAQKVADGLRSKGFAVFFDPLYESKMWGRDLSEYLMNVYYKQSRYCMMLISEDYVSKAWPTHERKSAIARHVESKGDYILPIRFDDSEVPGLPPTTKYIDATERTPEEIVRLFEQRLEN